MKIAVNTRFLLSNKLEGIGMFTHEIFKRVVQLLPEHEFYFIFDRPYSEEFVFQNNVKPIVVAPPARHPFLWYWWFEKSIPKILKENNIDTVVVGLPRDINGNETAQTRKARHFAGELADKTDMHIVLHDEFATSERARQKLGKVSRNQEKSQLDAAAAAVLLDDYMESMV